jgi:hypothetical protein
VRGCTRRKEIAAGQGLVGRGSGDDGLLCGEPMSLPAAPEPKTIRPWPALNYDPINSWLPGPLHYLCALEALPDASILLAVLTFMWCVVPEEPFRMEHLMAEALLLIMAVSLGTISCVVAHELAKRNR